MKKNEFLESVVEPFLVTHPAWKRVYEIRRRHLFVVGRQLPGVLVYLDFEARSDNDVFGQGVGWTADLQSLIDDFNPTSTPPFKQRDGQLKRLRTLERPRNFEHGALTIPTSSLCRPTGAYFLSSWGNYEAIREQMLREIDEYALPYLCMMLKFRHAREVTPEQLARDQVL
jgi:hypothetical protein